MSAVPALAGLGAAVALVALAFGRGGFHLSTVPVALGVWLALATLVIVAHARRRERRFGTANLVTAVRAGIVAVLAGLVPDAARLAEPAMVPWLWAATALALVALVLDGVDGWIARRRGESSSFGARFDMETDAALGLVMALLIWRSGETGAWVLGLGTLRYLFVAASWRWSALGGELYPSLRRKTVCVVQIGALAAMLSPLVSAPASTAVGGVALALLVGSFARDATWLLRGGTRAKSGRGARAAGAGPVGGSA